MSNEPSNKLAVHRDGDNELWVVGGTLDDGFEWSLPIVIWPHKTSGDPAEQWDFLRGTSFSWSPRQHTELTMILDRHACVTWPEGRWYRRDVLEKFARKAQGITPEFYVRWPGYEVPVLESVTAILEIPAEPGFNNDELKFLKHLQNVTGTQTWEALKFLWLAFRKQSILWVAQERRPLDLGFIRIVPTPYRVNWKEILAVRFRGVLSCFRSFPREKRQETLNEAGFFEALAGVKLLAVDKEKMFCHWTVESTPSKELSEAIDEQEYAKLMRLGPAGYARHVLRSMAARLPDTLKTFSDYVRLVSIPVGKITESSRSIGSEIIVPDLRGGRVTPGKGIVDTIDLSSEPFARLNDTNDFKPAPDTVKIPDFVRDVEPFKQLPEKIESKGFS